MQRLDLAGEWRLARASTGDAVPAAVPGDTHSALMAAGRIPDPYLGRNELDVQWVGREDWVFERAFQIPRDFLSEASVLLNCDRLDTIADVEINGRRAGHADNMFERWRFEVKRLLKPGRNHIRVRFRSAEKEALAESRRLPYPIPHTTNPVQSMHRNLVRKVQCHSGWDWGPCLMVAGIYGDISLQATSQARIEYVYTEQQHSRNRCRLRVFVECEVITPGEYPLTVDLDGQQGSHTFTLAKGRHRVSVDVSVADPRLWWPNGLGEQKLYGLTVELGGDRVQKRIGLRSLEL
ncbi:MAG TPA: glycoside hydrolase family 2 protein, partial [Spirochaetia bacterium]|nr:glycoside hydrolase family 2 protein [Spirochaetia bacterium]